MALLRNPQTGEIVIADDPTGALQQGFTLATDEEADAYARQLDLSTPGEQAQAFAERAVRGATLGAVQSFEPGMGATPESIARGEMFQEQSPVAAFAADVVPDVAVSALTGGLGGLATGAGRAAARGAVAEGAGLLRAGLAAGRAGGAAALAAESLGGGLVGAGQAASAEGQYLGEDLGRDAENLLFFGGLNFGLGAFALRGAKRGGRVAAEAAEEGAGELDDVARVAELDAAARGIPDETIGTVPETMAPAEGASEIDALSRQFNQVTGLPERVKELLVRRQQMSGRMDLGAGVTTPRKLATAAEEMGLTEAELKGFMMENRIPTGRGGTVIPSELHSNPNLSAFLDRIAVERYTENSAFKVNRKLRTVGWDKPWSYPGASAPEKRYDEGLKGIANRAAEFLRRAPEQESPIWRGTGVPQAQLDEWLQSGVVTDKGFQSFSTNEIGARNFMPTESYEGQFAEIGNHQRVLLRSPRGGYHYGGPEQEVMFPPDAKFRITGVSREANDVILDVEPIAATRPPSRASERGMAQLSPRDREALEAVSGAAPAEALYNRIGPNFTIRDVLASPMGNVTMTAGGAAAGGAIGDDEGAVAGGVAGLVASLLLGRRGAGAARRGVSSLQSAERRVAEKTAVEDGVQRAVARASRSDAEDIVTRAIRSEPEAEAAGLGRQRRLYINRDAVMASAEREFRDDLNAGMGELQRVVKGEKQAIIAGKVSANEGAQRAVADGIAQDAAKFAGELRGEARAYAQAAGKTGAQYAIPGAKSLQMALMDHAKALGEAKTGKALFSALDDFKRASQDIKQSLEAGALNSTNPIHHQQLIPRIDSFEKKIRSALEDSGTWGPAGEMQRAYNAVISDKLMPSLRTFEESVMERTHRGYDGLWKMEGWETKIRSLLANTDPGRRRHAAAVFDAMDELASVRRRFGDPKTAERLEASAAKMRRTIGLADEVTDATERMEALGTIAGAVPLFGGMARNMALGNLQQAVDRLSGAAEAAAARGVDDWIRSSRARGAGLRIPLPGLGELSPEARQLRDVAVWRGVSQGMALFMGEDETPGAAFERLRDSLIDEDAFFESLSDDYGSLQQESPELFMTLAGRAALARGFLLERMPPNVAVSVAKPNGHPPSREAIEDWSEYVNAVRHPERIARNLAGISVQQIETLRTVHPRFHELLQQRMLERIATAQQTGEQLDDTFLVRAGLLFPDLDGLASPVFSREFGKVVRDFSAQQRQGQAQRSGGAQKPTPSPMMSTINHGATFGTGF